MLYGVTGDIFSGGYDIVCHQVNCQGVMRAGIAKDIRTHYPYAYDEYIKTFKYIKNNNKATSALLGHINFCVPGTEDMPIVVNMFAQDKFGLDKAYTDYQAFQNCLSVLQCLITDNPEIPDSYKVAFPYKIGCGLGGGDWGVIRNLLEKFALNVRQDVYIVRLGANHAGV